MYTDEKEGQPRGTAVGVKNTCRTEEFYRNIVRSGKEKESGKGKMAGHKRKTGNRQKLFLAAAIALVVVIVLITALAVVMKKYSPSKEQTDYASFYNLDSEDDIMICVDNTVLDQTGLMADSEVYLPYEVVSEYLNDRFFWDSTEQILRYTLPEGIVNVSGETSEYMIGRSSETFENTILFVQGDQMYLSLSFIEQYTDIRSEIFEDPARVVISDEWGTVDYTKVKWGTEVREKGGIKSPVLTEVKRGDLVIVLEEMDSWSKICTEDGFVGYIKNSALGGTQSVLYESEYTEPEFQHITSDHTVNMAWHQVTNQTANGQVSSVLSATSGVNVISPTWFALSDNEGGISSYANSDYVSYCHENGVEVWALVSNFENEEVDTEQVLNVTSNRDALVNNLISEAIRYNLDGINVDFEMLDEETAPGFLQFIRELSLRCEANDLVLSVDNYSPASYNAFYNLEEQAVFADYIVLMAYDEHYNGSEEGSVASLGFVSQSVADALEEVSADQLILGIPFYTRLWKLTPDDSEAGYSVSSEALGMSEAESRVAANGAAFQWLEDEGQYYAEYEYEGSTYKIWLEDQNSIEKKLEVMQSNGLAGVSFWRLGYEKNTVWDTIAEYMD